MLVELQASVHVWDDFLVDVVWVDGDEGVGLGHCQCRWVDMSAIGHLLFIVPTISYLC